jgi:rubrerythrin
MARSKDEESKRVRMMGDLTNRTGLLSHADADAMREASRAFTPVGTVDEHRDFRAGLLREGGPVGTIPRPPNFSGAAKQAVAAVTGAQPLVLLDKLAERLAFERSGTRLYETLLLKFKQEGGFEGGPNVEELETIRRDELEHFRTLAEFIEELGGDPTAVTPSADVAAVASMGIVQLVCDPRVSFGESLEAILIAELVDHECWKALRELARESGNERLEQFAERAEAAEDMHLSWVRSWVQARTLGEPRQQPTAGG